MMRQRCLARLAPSCCHTVGAPTSKFLLVPSKKVSCPRGCNPFKKASCPGDCSACLCLAICIFAGIKWLLPWHQLRELVQESVFPMNCIASLAMITGATLFVHNRRALMLRMFLNDPTLSTPAASVVDVQCSEEWLVTTSITRIETKIISANAHRRCLSQVLYQEHPETSQSKLLRCNALVPSMA